MELFGGVAQELFSGVAEELFRGVATERISDESDFQLALSDLGTPKKALASASNRKRKRAFAAIQPRVVHTNRCSHDTHA